MRSKCIHWTGTRTAGGYGQIRYEGKSHYAHRAIYRAVVGPIPPGHGVLHRCDNPPCVNPKHLFTGTQADNNRDMQRKGRSRGPMKLSKLDKLQMRIERLAGSFLKDLSEKYGVSEGTVSSICNRRHSYAKDRT